MGERIFEQDTLCLVGIEPTYAAGAALTAAANAMRVKVDFNPMDGEQEAMSYDAGRGGSQGSIRRSKFVSGNLDNCYLSGSGTAGTAPPYSVLLEMAGLKPTVVAGASVTYAPVFPVDKSGVVQFYRGRVKHEVKGARCGFELTLGTNALPKLKFTNLMGLYVEPVHVASFQNANFAAFKTPLPTEPVNITVMTLFGQEVKMTELQLKGGQDIKYRSVTNEESVQHTGRKPQIEITFEEPEITEFNWWELVDTYGALEYQLGQDVVHEGFIFELNAPNLQLLSITPTLVDGISHLKAVLDVVPTERDNDFTMVFR